ncbi:hypothetical protein GGS21DRAFT_538881 [Xylaria nigripes]|nr:hypothetical protein GGS21DRAFT_538881 [Xylaria nigripes]
MGSEASAQVARSVYHSETHEVGQSSLGCGGHPEDRLESERALVQHQTRPPPPYPGPSDNAVDSQCPTVPRAPQHYTGLPVLDYRLYLPPLFELSTDCTNITSKSAHLSENANALSSLIRSLATVPPKLHIVIHGSRGEYTDFKVQLNLMSLLVPDNPQDRMDHLRFVARDEIAYRGGREPSINPSLRVSKDEMQAWCARFVEDQSPVKTFTMERVVTNFDYNWLEGQIRGLVASTNYTGMVTVQFPVTHARATVRNPDKANKFFTSITTLLAGKAKYEVVQAVWPFANAKNGEPGRKCTVLSEQAWWKEWRDPIKFAILQKRQGWVTNEDRLECIMGNQIKEFVDKLPSGMI